ncbi:box C/D snoRNA protein 1 [Aplochiton taeniatus]
MDDKQKGMKRKIALVNCGVCGSLEAKYRCPGCLKHSCSLSCVQTHKADSGCSGVRDKTAFVALSQFDEINLLNDYRFLEDTGRLADGATRDPIAHTNFNYKAKTLAASARKLNITLRFLPITFTKSRENSTIRHFKGHHFFWHLKLLFPQSGTAFTERRVADERTLEHILSPYIHPMESDPVRRQKLKMYVSSSAFDHVKVFMKVEGRKANSVRYHELDLAKSLRDNLSYKTVIEYPVLHVVLRGHCHDYPLKEPGKIQPVSEKRAKMENMDEELEDGEIRDSSDEEEANMEDEVLVKGGSNGDVGIDNATVVDDLTTVHSNGAPCFCYEA